MWGLCLNGGAGFAQHDGSVRMARSLLEIAAQVAVGFAWPVTILVIIYLFRGPIAAKLERVTTAVGPGGTRLDFELVQKIVKEGQAQNLDATQITARIRQAVSNKDQLRILRALVDEENGRYLANYQTGNYKQAIDELIGKGYVRRGGSKYYLSESGFEAVRTHLMTALALSTDASS